MKKLLIVCSFVLVSLNAFAESWPLSVEYSSTNALGITEIRGESAAGAGIAAMDANGSALFCLPFFGIVGEDGTFNCWGKNLVAPVTVTAKNSPLSAYSENASSTVAVGDVNSEGQPWPLAIEKVQTTFFGLTEVSGTSLEGAYISAADVSGRNLFCLPIFGLVSADNTFTCFGFGVSLPITVTAESGLASVTTNYTTATALAEAEDDTDTDTPDVT